MKANKFKIITEGKLTTISSIDSNNWKFNFWTAQLDNKKILTDLRTVLLENESVIINKYEGKTDGGTGLGPESTTARYSSYNLLNELSHQSLKEFQIFFKTEYLNFLKELNLTPSNIRATCWYNILHYGQHIARHFHGDLSRMSCNFTVDSYNTSTVYEMPFESGLFEIKNEPGRITFFNSLVPHWTTEHGVYKERISIAADLYDDECISKELESVMYEL